MLFLFASITGFSANRYWIGNGTSTSWNNTANWSTASGGSGGATVPGNADVAIFDASGTGNCSVDATVNVAGLSMQSGYTGTVSQGVYSITVGGSHAILSGGAFTGGSHYITVNGNLTLSGTAFTSTTATLTVTRNFNNSSNSFTHNSGTVQIGANGTTSAQSLTGSAVFNNLIFGTGSVNTVFTLSSGTVFTVNGTLTLSSTIRSITLNTGIIEAYGNVMLSNNATGGGGTATLKIKGGNNQTMTGSGLAGTSAVCNVLVDKTGGTLTLASIISCGSSWTYTQGTVSAGTTTVVFCGTGNIDAQGTSIDMSFYDLNIYSGTSTLTGTLAVSHDLSMNTGASLNAGSYTASIGEDWSNSGGTFSPGTGTVVFNGTAAPQTIVKTSGTESFYNLQVNKSAGTLQLNGPVNITNQLILTQGPVVSTSTNLLSMADNSTVSGGSISSYLAGPIKKTGDDAFTFPLGSTTLSSGNYHPLSITAPAVSTDAFTAEYVASSGLTYGTNAHASLKYLSDCEHWTLTRAAGTSSVKPSITWNTNSCSNGYAESTTIGAWGGTIWSNLGKALYTGNNTLGSVEAATAIDFTAGTIPLILARECGLVINAGNNQQVCFSDSVTLTGSVTSGGFPSYTYSWLPQSGISNPALSNATCSPATTTTYTLTVTDSQQCTASSQVTITVNPLVNYSGSFTVGGPGATFTTVVDAVSSLNCKSITDTLTFLIRDNTYADVIDLRNNVYFTTNGSPVIFKAENEDAQNVIISNGAVLVDIEGKENVIFQGITFTTPTSTGAKAMSSSNIWFSNCRFNGGAMLNAVSINNTNNFHFINNIIEGFATGITSTGQNDSAKIVGNSFTIPGSAIDFANAADLVIAGNTILSPANLSTPALKVTEADGSLSIVQNEIETAQTGIYVGKTISSAEIADNSIRSSSDAVFILSYAGSVVVMHNNIDTSNTNGIKIKDNSIESDLLDGSEGKSLQLIQNSISCSSKAISVTDVKNSHLLMNKNTIKDALIGMELTSLDADSAYALMIAGNLIHSKGNSLVLENNRLATTIKSNTIISEPETSGAAAALSNSDNITFHANILNNIKPGYVIQFDAYTPANISSLQNNMFSFTGSTLLNRNAFTTTTLSSTENPMFIMDGTWALSTKSGLLDTVTAQYDSLIYEDVYGITRYPKYDVGGVESGSTSIDGLKVDLLLENGVMFSPDGDSRYDQFVIQGLNNFSSTTLTIYNRAGSIISQSTGASSAWDGINMQDQQLVEEGYYRYELNLDNKIVKGFVYVKR